MVISSACSNELHTLGHREILAAPIPASRGLSGQNLRKSFYTTLNVGVIRESPLSDIEGIGILSGNPENRESLAQTG